MTKDNQSPVCFTVTNLQDLTPQPMQQKVDLITMCGLYTYFILN